MTEQTTFDIDAILDGTLDDLADLPEFRPLPVGTYQAQFKIERADANKSPNVFFAKLKITETVELANPEEKPVETGAEANVRYDLSNEFGQGAFKKLMSALAEHFGAKKTRELLEDVKEYVDVFVVTKQNTNKKNGQVYSDIVELKVV
jgi:hypothetical protein